VPGAIETLEDPGLPDPGPEGITGPRGSAPSGGVRFAPSGTFGVVTVSAGASDADFPSSADADSVCAETVPVHSDAANAAPATTATAPVSFMPNLPSGSSCKPVSPGAQQPGRAPEHRTTRGRLCSCLRRGPRGGFACRQIGGSRARAGTPRAVLCMMHESSVESRSGCTMTRSSTDPKLFRMAGGCNLPEEFRSWRPVVSRVVEGRSDRW
jgi:hypothetical protein